MSDSGFMDRLMAYPALYEKLRWVFNLGSFERPTARHLRAEPGESVLDMGCGTGGYCRIVPGAYLGVDLSPFYIAYARRKFGSPARRCEVMDVRDLKLPDRSFDKVLLHSVLHHLTDEDALRALREAARVARRAVLVVDSDLGRSNAIQRWILNRDRGSHIRSLETLHALISPVMEVERTGGFRSRSGSVTMSALECRPRA